MAIVIGIDVGISTTKIVGINEKEKVISPIRIKATDPVTSLYGAFGKYLYDNNIALTDVKQVLVLHISKLLFMVYQRIRLRSLLPMAWVQGMRPTSTE